MMRSGCVDPNGSPKMSDSVECITAEEPPQFGSSDKLLPTSTSLPLAEGGETIPDSPGHKLPGDLPRYSIPTPSSKVKSPPTRLKNHVVLPELSETTVMLRGMLAVAMFCPFSPKCHLQPDDRAGSLKRLGSKSIEDRCTAKKVKVKAAAQGYQNSLEKGLENELVEDNFPLRQNGTPYVTQRKKLASLMNQDIMFNDLHKIDISSIQPEVKYLNYIQLLNLRLTNLAPLMNAYYDAHCALIRQVDLCLCAKMGELLLKQAALYDDVMDRFGNNAVCFLPFSHSSDEEEKMRKDSNSVSPSKPSFPDLISPSQLSFGDALSMYGPQRVVPLARGRSAVDDGKSYFGVDSPPRFAEKTERLPDKSNVGPDGVDMKVSNGTESTALTKQECRVDVKLLVYAMNSKQEQRRRSLSRESTKQPAKRNQDFAKRMQYLNAIGGSGPCEGSSSAVAVEKEVAYRRASFPNAPPESAQLELATVRENQFRLLGKELMFYFGILCELVERHGSYFHKKFINMLANLNDKVEQMRQKQKGLQLSSRKTTTHKAFRETDPFPARTIKPMKGIWFRLLARAKKPEQKSASLRGRRGSATVADIQVRGSPSSEPNFPPASKTNEGTETFLSDRKYWVEAFIYIRPRSNGCKIILTKERPPKKHVHLCRVESSSRPQGQVKSWTVHRIAPGKSFEAYDSIDPQADVINELKTKLVLTQVKANV